MRSERKVVVAYRAGLARSGDCFHLESRLFADVETDIHKYLYKESGGDAAWLLPAWTWIES
jgi:hypothetical protein